MSAATALAYVGPGACIADESVLAMHGLASVNPAFITVGTSKRVRKDLPDYVHVVPIAPDARIAAYDGIPSMPVADAIRRCKTKIMPERLQEAVRDGVDKGVISRWEEPLLEKEIG